jgi:hypothetical protein
VAEFDARVKSPWEVARRECKNSLTILSSTVPIGWRYIDRWGDRLPVRPTQQFGALGFLDGVMKQLLATIAILGAGALLAYASYMTTRWGGSYGYNQLEYELTFQDSNGNPIDGVELMVEDRRGKKFFCFPVTDYLPEQAPKSDKDGVMRFHHVSTAVEWDNYGWSLFWCFPIHTTRSPDYICRFLRGGKEVHRIRYAELPDWDWPGRGWEDVPKVKRRWNWPAMIPNEIAFRAGDTSESYDARLALFFHHDGNGNSTREVRVACRNAYRLADHKRDAAEEIEFPVIRRTIVVDP